MIPNLTVVLKLMVYLAVFTGILVIINVVVKKQNETHTQVKCSTLGRSKHGST